ncbi:MAG: class I SAM-dependent methyltransferase [Candidatus Omnitrophota bacterium]|nr:class I SAM-dependent methyltransferase [Candidatus Omnitrophota bacterium]
MKKIAASWNFHDIDFILMATSDMDNATYAKKHINLYTGEIPPLLKKHLDLFPWQRLVDAGCGDGAVLYALRDKGYLKGREVFAFDSSSDRVAIASKIDGRIRCFTDDACAIKNIAPDSVDFIITGQVIEHVDSDDRMIRELKAILRKGGILYLSTVFKKWYGWYFYRNMGRWTLDPTHVREYRNDAELLEIMRRYGLEVLESRKSPIRFPLMHRFLRCINAPRHIAAKEWAAYLRWLSVPVPGYFLWELVCKKTD